MCCSIFYIQIFNVILFQKQLSSLLFLKLISFKNFSMLLIIKFFVTLLIDKIIVLVINNFTVLTSNINNFKISVFFSRFFKQFFLIINNSKNTVKRFNVRIITILCVFNIKYGLHFILHIKINREKKIFRTSFLVSLVDVFVSSNIFHPLYLFLLIFLLIFHYC